MKPLTVVGAMALTVASCATSSSFELTVPPATHPKRFTAVEVAPITSDWVPDDGLCPAANSPDWDPTCSSESVLVEIGSAIRRGIIDELTGSGDFALVVSELDPAPGAVLISCSIVEFDEGSRFTRWFVGLGAGKAQLKMACGFTDLTDAQPYAEGLFSGELKGGFFGGEADAGTMGREVGEAIRRFLRTGLADARCAKCGG
ncbi:MAG: DUF4410 domain-containing protein [Gemmatimonadota bacterium]